jgi:hypothetical protein
MTAATNPANIPTTILSAFESMVGSAPLLLADTVELGAFTELLEADIGRGVVDGTILEVVIEGVGGLEMEEMGVEDEIMSVGVSVSVGISVGVSVGLGKV